MSESTLRIGVLLPEVLGTYSDAGSGVVLAQRARWRGIGAELVRLGADGVPAAGCDIYLLGGGEDVAQQFAVAWLRRFPNLLHALDERALTLAVCAGLQILGTAVSDAGGRDHAGLGLLDVVTRPGRRRAVGEIITRCELPGVGLLTGFENHLGTTLLGPGAAPLGRVLAGEGNGAGRDQSGLEGAMTGRIIGTYLHCPVLARNPALADHILHLATGDTLAELDLPDQSQVRGAHLGETVRRPRRPRRRSTRWW